MGRLESYVEDYLIAQVKLRNGFTRKTIYQGRTGSPDRWCFFPKGDFLMVETKSHGKPLRSDQEEELKLLRKQGFYVAVADSKTAVDNVLLDFEIIGLTQFNERHPL